MMEDLDELFGVPPGHTLRRGPAGAKERVKERVWAALEANRRERRRKQNMRYGGLAAAATLAGISFLPIVLSPAVPLAASRQPAPSHRVSPPPAAPAALPWPQKTHVAGKKPAPTQK